MLHKPPQHILHHFWSAWQAGAVWIVLLVGWQKLVTSMRDRLRPLSSRMFSHIYQLTCFLYYSLVFGQHGFGEKSISSLVHALEKRQNTGDLPVAKEIWDLQYINKRWNYLSSYEEASHYSVIVGYIQYFKPTGSILDIGCGEGILQARLTACGYSRYVGIDISDAAIQKARLREDAQTVFLSGDAESYIPLEPFDVIVFNEVLYYFNDPLKIFARYMDFLKEDGILITSLFWTTRSAAIRRRIKEVCPALVETRVTDTFKDFTWFCNVFMSSKRLDDQLEKLGK